MFFPILLFLHLCLAHPFRHSQTTLPAIRQLAQFPNATWIENLAVRSNGQILVTLLTSPDLFQINPFDPTCPPQLVAQFPSALGTLGIAEIEEDVFAIAKGNFSAATGPVNPHSFSVWKADLRDSDVTVLSKIVDIPDAGILNGATTVGGEGRSKVLLLADSIAGVVWRVELDTLAYDAVLNDTTTQPAVPVAQGGFGVNGIHARDGFLHFTNLGRGYFRVPINADGSQAGPVQTLANFTGADDFTFDEAGNTFVARGVVDVIERVSAAGQVVSLNFTDPDSLVLLEGNTAVKFGRTAWDRKTLYVTTNGGLGGGLVNGTAIQGGRLLAIDL